MLNYENLQLYLRLGLKVKIIGCVLEFRLKSYVKFNTEKKIRSRKNGNKNGKALYKLMNNIVCGETWKTM